MISNLGVHRTGGCCLPNPSRAFGLDHTIAYRGGSRKSLTYMLLRHGDVPLRASKNDRSAQERQEPLGGMIVAWAVCWVDRLGDEERLDSSKRRSWYGSLGADNPEGV
jgi:hypothetical protein